MKNLAKHRRQVAAGLTALALGLGLAACQPSKELRGTLPDKETIAEVKPGVTTRETVSRILGSPSATATFDKETWFYIGERTETTAFFKPKVTEHKVLVVHFDDKGVVQDVRQVDALKDGRDVELVGRETPTKGREMTIIQQLVGNVGRFNKPGGSGE